MSASRSYPSFGVSRKNQNHHNNHNHIQIPPQALIAAAAAQQQQQQQQQAQVPQQIILNNNSNIKIPVININHQQGGNTGDIALNTEDTLLYYHNGRKWVALSTNNDQCLKVENNNIKIAGKQHSSGMGGNIAISSGAGGLGDGSITLEVGGEPALTVNEKELVIQDRQVTIKNGNLLTSTVISETAIHHDMLSGNKPTLTMQGEYCVATINVMMPENTNMVFYINNPTVREDSWVQITSGSDGGIPSVWVDNIQMGRIEVVAYCLKGMISQLKLFIHVKTPYQV